MVRFEDLEMHTDEDGVFYELRKPDAWADIYLQIIQESNDEWYVRVCDEPLSVRYNLSNDYEVETFDTPQLAFNELIGVFLMIRGGELTLDEVFPSWNENFEHDRIREIMDYVLD